jgi:SAM-dependent methyltransferase
MASLIPRRETCRMCGSRELELVFQLAPSPLGDLYISADRIDQMQQSYPIDLFLCRDCGLAQLLDVFPWEILFGEPRYHKPGWVLLDEHKQHFVDEMMSLLKASPNSLVIDIGSDEGALLSCFKNKEMRVLGVDPAQEAAQEATAAGIMTLPEFLTPALAHQIREKHESATIITANNVFANIDDLKAVTESIRDLLAPEGVFVFESIYLADLIQNMGFDFIYHEHLSAFSVMPIQSFFRRMGMELFDVKRIPTKGGSLRFMVQLAGASRRVEPSVASLIEFESNLGLYRPETFKFFAGKVDALKAQTLDLLRELKDQGKSIAGFGASITVTTLIYHFEIGEFLEYLVDDNPAKQGCFSPGRHLPVFSSDALYERKPDYVVILAWRFFEPIVKKNHAFLKQGGHFIVPVPKVRII